MATDNDIQARLDRLGIALTPPIPGGNYATVKLYGDSLAFTSGHNCKVGGILPHVGKVGLDVTVEQACGDARQCIVNLLGSLEQALGDLGRVKQVLKITGFVACSDDFGCQSQVLDAASDLLVDIFGDSGRGVRTAVGVNVLPNNQPVAIELLLEIAPQ